MNRIQKMPHQLFIDKTPLTDKNTYLFYYKAGKKYKVTMTSPAEAMLKLKDAEKKGFGAFVSTFVPCNNQHGVIAYTAAGETKELYDAKNVYNTVKKAYDSVFDIKTTEPSKKEAQVQKIVKDKEDPWTAVVLVRYDGSSKIYTFRCRQWHFEGEKVCVHTSGKYENVTVVDMEIMRESEVKAMAKKLGRDDLAELYCEEAIDFASLARPTEQAVKEAEEYTENIDELRGMSECFMPAYDYNTNADRDGYIHIETDIAEDEPFDDLPE